MKSKTIALAIVATTGALIGLLYFTLNRQPTTTKEEAIATPTRNQPKEKTKPLDLPPPLKEDSEPNDNLKESHATKVPEEIGSMKDPAPPDNKHDLDPADIKKIKGVAALSEQELSKQLAALKNRIENEDIFDKLENGDLTKEQELEAKKALETFALLGLEQTRRRFMAIEPELKDPIYAHRESLKEIRELLEDE